MLQQLHIGNKHRIGKNEFKYTFARKLILHSSDKLSLDFISLYYTWRNIKEEYNNNRLTIETHSIDTLFPATVDVVIPDGSYEISDINNFIHLKMEENNDMDLDGTYGINIYANKTYNRVTIITDGKHGIDFTSPEFRDMLGFSSDFIEPGSSVHGDKIAKIERVECIYLKCNLVYNDLQPDSTYMYSFVPSGSFGSQLNVSPQYPRWTSCSEGEYTHAVLSLVDQDGRDLEDLEDNVSIIFTILFHQTNLSK